MLLISTSTVSKTLSSELHRGDIRRSFTFTSDGDCSSSSWDDDGYDPSVVYDHMCYASTGEIEFGTSEKIGASVTADFFTVKQDGGHLLEGTVETKDGVCYPIMLNTYLPGEDCQWDKDCMVSFSTGITTNYKNGEEGTVPEGTFDIPISCYKSTGGFVEEKEGLEAVRMGVIGMTF